MIEGSYPSAWRAAAAILAGESLDAVYVENGRVFEFGVKLRPRKLAPVKLPPLFVQLRSIALRWNTHTGKLEDV
jgi:hypothetical protein